jgi:alkylation response protein AidB-like acyl-CoA dehydrogenase
MDFGLTDDYRQLVETVRAFAETHFTFENVTQWRRDEGLPDEVVRDFVNLDFNGFGVIHRRNHKTYDVLAQVLVLEELARVSGSTMPLMNDFLNLQILEEFAATGESEAMRSRYQDEGRLAFALAISEPQSGSDLRSMATATRKVHGKLLLDGSKIFVNNGEYAPYLLVAAIDADNATDDKPELSFWLVPHSAPGVEVYPIEKIGQSMLPFSTVEFNNVVLEESWRLHGKRSGFKQLFKFFEMGRLLACATSLGLAQAAMEDALAFAEERRAFKQPITEFQLVQEMIVDMELKLQNMRMSVYRTAWLLDSGATEHEVRMAVALCKRYVPKTATEVASDAMQIMGGRGYTCSQRAASIWEDCRGFQIAEGTDQIMVHIAAPMVLERYRNKREGK